MHHLGAIHIFTFKKGLLSRLAHDLRLTVQHFDIELRGGHVHGRFEVASTRVDGVVVGERVDESKFTRQDNEVIERNMREAILNADRFPVVEVEGEIQTAGLAWALDGRLTMVGRSQGIHVPLVRAGSDVIADVDITPSLWGIRPFTTMGGAIGIEDRWRVHAQLSLGGDSPTHLLQTGSVARWSG